jgi:hypothetical protein
LTEISSCFVAIAICSDVNRDIHETPHTPPNELTFTPSEQAPYNDIHPAVPVPLELLLYSRITEFPSVAAAQGSTGGIPVPVEAADFEASSNLVASVARWGGKPTKVAAGQFWNDLVDATEYPRLAGIRVPPAMKRQLSIASDTTSASDRTSSSR